MKMLDISGRKFNRLKVLEFSHIAKTGTSMWKCICDCGKVVIVRGNHLKTGHAKSCGCWRDEKLSKSATTHGLSQKRFYLIWMHIHQRCNYPSHKSYPNYGGRGIRCEWKSFEEFRDDMYKSYQSHTKKFGEKNTTIDRIDYNGNYSRENCRWANWVVQNNNKRKRPKLLSHKRNWSSVPCEYCGVRYNHSHKLSCRHHQLA